MWASSLTGHETLPVRRRSCSAPRGWEYAVNVLPRPSGSPQSRGQETSANIDVKKGAFSHFGRQSEGWESYRSKEQKSRLSVIFGHRVEIGNWKMNSLWFFLFWGGSCVLRMVVLWGVRRSVSGELASPPTLAGTLPIESTIAENVLSSHMGDNTPRLTAEWTPGEGLSPRRDPDFLVSANSLGSLCPRVRPAPWYLFLFLLLLPPTLWLPLSSFNFESKAACGGPWPYPRRFLLLGRHFKHLQRILLDVANNS